MKKEFVPFEIAKDLRDLGFDKSCLMYYDIQSKELFLNDLGKNSVNLPELLLPAPLWQQVIDWFREKHNIQIYPHHCEDGILFIVVGDNFRAKDHLDQIRGLLLGDRKKILFTDFYKAREDGVLKAIKKLSHAT